MDSQKDWPHETWVQILEPRTEQAEVTALPPLHLACMGLAWHVRSIHRLPIF